MMIVMMMTLSHIDSSTATVEIYLMIRATIITYEIVLSVSMLCSAGDMLVLCAQWTGHLSF